MKTLLTNSALRAAQFLLKGEVVAFPTETVYGLGANAFDEVAVQKIFTAKGRPSDNPIIIHISDLAELKLLITQLNPLAEKLIDAFFPGSLTLVLPKSKYVPQIVSAGLKTVGVRMPSNPIAQQFLSECGVSVAAPSANLSGRPSPTSWESVREDLDSKISCILKGKPSTVGLESTVVDCTGKVPIILRSGAITLEDLQRVIPTTKFASHRLTATPKSPGMKYKHYSPHAKVVLVDRGTNLRNDVKSAYIGISKLSNGVSLTNQLICSSIKDYAQHLFQFFRVCDANHVKLIYCEAVQERGLGVALMDRLKKASSH